MTNEESKQEQQEELNELETPAELAAETPKVQSAEEKYNELNDKYLRLYSEFDNFRRRTAKERIELYKNASEELINELLPVLDDFERAIDAMSKSNDINVLSEGVSLVHHKMANILKNKGLSSFDAVGKDFNPDYHEAITKIPAPKKKLKGKVVDVIEKGYKLNDKVLRYAKVVVGE